MAIPPELVRGSADGASTVWQPWPMQPEAARVTAATPGAV
jgi:hypothetical protein